MRQTLIIVEVGDERNPPSESQVIVVEKRVKEALKSASNPSMVVALPFPFNVHRIVLEE